jgi:chemotaxis protein methyltransferase CheR
VGDAVTQGPPDESPLSIDRTALENLASLLLEKVGLKITPDGYYGLRLAMQARMPALGLSDGQEYVRRLKQMAGEGELRALLPLVTVGKTEFFRDTRQFRALEKVLMPEMLSRARRRERQVEIWSAGCATGEEPYSIAMAAIEAGALGGEVDIWGTDLNPAAVEFAKTGLYPVRRMIGVSEERLARFFTLSDAGYQVTPSVCSLVRFEGHNLAAPVFPHIYPASKDLILCRNVIIYFDQPTIRGLMDRFFDALRPGGVLLLGYSESLFRISSKFEMFEIDGTFAYRRPWPEAQPSPPPPRPSAPLPPVGAPRPHNTVLPRRPTTGTFRIPVPSPSAPPPTKRPAEVHRTPVERLEDVVRLVEKGDFPQAMLAARRLTDDHPEDLAALLTLGNVHALMSNPEEARDCFSRALKAEPLCVEARIYLGLAALQEGKLEEARSELQKGLFLEPTLALGHYLLAQVQEKLGATEGARRSYRNAVQQRRYTQRALLGHYPELPGSAEAIAQAAQFRLAALSEV